MSRKIKRDEILMLEYADGNTAAFEELFRRYGQKIYNLFLRSLGQADLAQDLLQECFMRVITGRHRYRPQNKFSSWLFTIAVNLVRDRYRASGRRQAYFDSKPFDESRPAMLPSENEPESNMEKSELREILRKAIQSLSREQQEIIYLSKYAGLSFAEISEVLNISPEAAKQKAYRALQNLRKKLAFLKEE